MGPVLLLMVLSRKMAEELCVTYTTPPCCEQKKEEKERRGRERRREEQAKERKRRRKIMSGCLLVVLSKIRKRIAQQVTLTRAVFSVRVQLLNAVEAPVPETYATPPLLVTEFLVKVQLVKRAELLL